MKDKIQYLKINGREDIDISKIAIEINIVVWCI